MVVAAMYDDNLLSVAQQVRQSHPHSRIVVCGDNDFHKEINGGKLKAIEAARAIGGEYCLPMFPPGVDGTDFNDLYCAGCLS